MPDILNAKDKKIMVQRIMRQELDREDEVSPKRSLVESEFYRDTNRWYEKNVVERLYDKERKLEEERLTKAERTLSESKKRPTVSEATLDYRENYLRKHNLADMSVVERMDRENQRSRVSKERIREEIAKEETPFKPSLSRSRNRSIRQVPALSYRRSQHRLSASYLPERDSSLEKSKRQLTGYEPNELLYKRLEEAKHL